MGHTCVNIHIHGETPRDSMLSIKSFTAWAPCADHVTSSLSNELNSRNTQLHIRSNKRLQLINSPLSLFTTINTPPTLYSMKSHNSLLLLLQPITELTLSWNKKNTDCSAFMNHVSKTETCLQLCYGSRLLSLPCSPFWVKKCFCIVVISNQQH